MCPLRKRSSDSNGTSWNIYPLIPCLDRRVDRCYTCYVLNCDPNCKPPDTCVSFETFRFSTPACSWEWEHLTTADWLSSRVSTTTTEKENAWVKGIYDTSIDRVWRRIQSRGSVSSHLTVPSEILFLNHFAFIINSLLSLCPVLFLTGTMVGWKCQTSSTIANCIWIPMTRFILTNQIPLSWK